MPVQKPENLYTRLGCMPAFQLLSELFHARIEADDLLRPLFPKDLTAVKEHLALFLAEQFGGPAEYRAKRGKQSLVCRHAHLAIGPKETARWLGHMTATLDEMGISGTELAELRAYFEETAATLGDPFIDLYDMPLEQLKVQLKSDPGLASAIDHGRTLLARAAREWDVQRVELLLAGGANVNQRGALEHDALYYAANGWRPGRGSDGRTVVELLLRHGASVHSRSGPGKMTALHMAARRGNVEIAEVLLAAGADPEARDKRGDTPLMRAINCKQQAMVALLNGIV